MFNGEDFKKISLPLNVDDEIEKPEVRGLYIIISLMGILGKEIKDHPNLIHGSKHVLETYYLCKLVKERPFIERKKGDFAEIVKEDVKNSIIVTRKFIFRRKKLFRKPFLHREENVKFGEGGVIRLNDVYRDIFNYINSKTVKNLRDFVKGKNREKRISYLL